MNRLTWLIGMIIASSVCSGQNLVSGFKSFMFAQSKPIEGFIEFFKEASLNL